MSEVKDPVYVYDKRSHNHVENTYKMYDELVAALEKLLDDYGNARNPVLAIEMYNLIARAKQV